ncbi:U2 small nuclear ribonucleoprotein A' [Camellia lanceoleosa]|uniref:U2 small nuclear ribonucleoprotein A n=1 Tax=Camellia lanceoleosa TaxID=1840588 RepID=A0ACC0GW63_9ERIC|nr:U2 small nuclear ribonucleoprotein A' [Camellia lanceoleosa]
MKKGYLLGFRNHHSQEVLIERRFVIGFCWKENSHKEQIEAKNLFSSEEDEEQAKKEFAKTFVPGEAPSIPEDPKEEQAPKPVASTPEQIITIKAAIVNSQTLEGVARLEKSDGFYVGLNCDEQALKSGQLPADLKIGDNDATTNTEATKEDKMVTDEENEANDGPSDAETEQKNESADMEQMAYWR